MATALSMSSTASKKVFVGGLSWETDETSLRDYFERYGPVSDCVIMRDRTTGHPRGFGFVTYDDQLVAERVAAEFHELDGRQVEAKIAVPRSECNPGARSHASRATKKVFVGGLPASCRESELHAHFARFGEVAECQVMYDHQTGNSRGFGFVTFVHEATVDRVVDLEAHSILAKHVEVKRAEPKQALEARRGRDMQKAYGGANSGGGNGTAVNGSAANVGASANGVLGSSNGAGLGDMPQTQGPYHNVGPWSSLFSTGSAWGKGEAGAARQAQGGVGGMGFFSPAQPYAPELAQCVYNAFYGSESAPEGFCVNVGSLPSARQERRFHPYPSRERVERSYR